MNDRSALRLVGDAESGLGRPEDLLRGAGLKVTATRVALLDLVMRRGHHMTADEITDGLHEQGLPVDRVTIYRNIERMMRERLLVADLQPGRALRVTVNRVPGAQHTHHVVCGSCGRVGAIGTCYIADNWERIRSEVLLATGYELEGHLIQFTGRCADCARARR